MAPSRLRATFIVTVVGLMIGVLRISRSARVSALASNGSMMSESLGAGGRQSPRWAGYLCLTTDRTFALGLGRHKRSRVD